MTTKSAERRAEQARWLAERDAERLQEEEKRRDQYEHDWREWLTSELGEQFMFQGYLIRKLYWSRLRLLRELYFQTPGVELPSRMDTDQVGEIADMVSVKPGKRNPRRCWIIRCGKQTKPERNGDGSYNLESVYLCPQHRAEQMRHRGAIR